jgi:hypothetical protein
MLAITRLSDARSRGLAHGAHIGAKRRRHGCGDLLPLRIHRAGGRVEEQPPSMFRDAFGISSKSATNMRAARLVTNTSSRGPAGSQAPPWPMTVSLAEAEPYYDLGSYQRPIDTSAYAVRPRPPANPGLNDNSAATRWLSAQPVRLFPAFHSESAAGASAAG